MRYSKGTSKIKEIDFTFENVESGSILTKDINDFQIEIDLKSRVIKKAEFTISKSIKGNFEGLQLDEEVERKTIVERIMEFNDITWMQFRFENDAMETFPVVWKADSTGCNNQLQTYIDSGDHIKIFLGESVV